MIKKASEQNITFSFINSPSQWTTIKQAVQDAIYLSMVVGFIIRALKGDPLPTGMFDVFFPKK
jgi:hypothetical protein